MGYTPRECPTCGANLDPGEICDCQKNDEAGTPAPSGTLEGAEEAAIQEAIAAACKITLEKVPGCETFKRSIEASSSSAAVNGVAVLIRELAAVLEQPVTSVLALLTVTLTVPAMQTKRSEGAGA